jgi:hypothetical protein
MEVLSAMGPKQVLMSVNKISEKEGTTYTVAFKRSDTGLSFLEMLPTSLPTLGEKTYSPTTMMVKSDTNCKNLALAITHSLKNNTIVNANFIGASAANQCIKAIAIASSKIPCWFSVSRKEMGDVSQYLVTITTVNATPQGEEGKN